MLTINTGSGGVWGKGFLNGNKLNTISYQSKVLTLFSVPLVKNGLSGSVV
jgi:hypothetical protein